MIETKLNLEVKKSENLSTHELAEITALCTRAFNQDFRPYMDQLHDAMHITGCLNGQLVSHACRVTRWLQAGDSPLLKTAYIEAVATEEKFRNRGFASAVMTRLAEEVSDYELAALGTGSPGFYSRLGWKRWQGPLFIRMDNGLKATPGEIVMVLSLPKSPPLDLFSRLSAEWREGEVW